MRCLHCGKRISLLRKLSDSEFCSDDHRQEFRQQQSDLALARLIDAQNRLERADKERARPAAKSKKQEKAPQEAVFPMAEILREPIRAVATPLVMDGSSSMPPTGLEPECPSIEYPLVMGGFGAGSVVPLQESLPAAPAAPRSKPSPLFERRIGLPATLDRTCFDRTAGVGAGGVLPLTTNPAWMPAIRVGPRAVGTQAAILLPGSKIPIATQAELPHPGSIAEIGPGYLEGSVGAPASAVAAPPAVAGPSVPKSSLQTSWRPPVVAQDPDPPVQWRTMPLTEESQAQPGEHRMRAAQAPLWVEPLVQLPAAHALTQDGAPCALKECEQTAPLAPPEVVTGARSTVSSAGRCEVAADTATPRMPAVQPEAPSLRSANRTAKLRFKAMAAAAGAATQREASAPARYLIAPLVTMAPVVEEVEAVRLAEPGLASLADPAVLESVEETIETREDWLKPLIHAAQHAAYPISPFRPEPPESSQPAITEPEEAEPPMQRLIPVLPPRPAGREQAPARWSGPVMAVKELPQPLIPVCHLTIDQADGSGPRSSWTPEKRVFAGDRLTNRLKQLPGSRFWMHAPADLKWVALGLPLLVVLVVTSFRPSSAPQVEKQKSEPSASYSAIGGELNTIQQVLLRRAAVKLYDDFRGGLGAWSGNDGWSKSWKYGEAGFLEPGQLAIYAPTVRMQNYTLQFLGQIEKRSLNWVFRAANPKNYYSMRIVIQRAGPMPEAALIRSTVIDGKETGVKSLPIPFPVQPDTMYLVRMTVAGADFTTYIQDQVVDSFHDERLVQGGVGFYGAKGDTGRLRWVEVTHQYDFLGRLCAMLAPYDVTTQGPKGN